LILLLENKSFAALLQLVCILAFSDSFLFFVLGPFFSLAFLLFFEEFAPLFPDFLTLLPTALALLLDQP
jgi:hypothetical protein